MSATAMSDAQTSWTWADQLSTYRFWGVLAFYVCSTAAVGLAATWLHIFLSRDLGLSHRDAGLTWAIISLAGFYGFYLAMAGVWWKTLHMLFAAGALQLAGAVLLTVPSLAGYAAIRIVGAIFFGIGAGTALLGVPTILASGLGGAHTFVASFGVVLALSRAVAMWFPYLTGALFDRFGSFALAGITVGSIVVGLLFLIPVKPSLFDEPPPPRGRSLRPTRRNPVAVAFLSGLVPFYALYWLYRAHGEVASLAPSPALLSPWGGVAAGFVAPLMLMTNATLIDQLNRRASEQGMAPLRSPLAVFLWTLLFIPVGFGLVQSAINRSIESAE